MRHADARKRALIGFTGAAVVGLTVFAPSASAQVGKLTETVSSTTTQVTDTVTTVPGPVRDTVDQTRGPVGSTTRKVTEATDPVGAAVDEATGTSLYETTKSVVQTTADSADKTIADITGPVAQTVEETTGLGNDPEPKGRKGKAPSNKPGAKTPPVAPPRIDPTGGRAAAFENAVNQFTTVRASEPDNAPAPSIFSALGPEEDNSFFSNVAEGAREAAKALAFPLALALAVAVFLVIQGRIDRKDAKLALAPIDPEQDLLSFQ